MTRLASLSQTFRHNLLQRCLFGQRAHELLTAVLYHNRIHQFQLDQYFNEQDLRDICFELGIDYEDLPFSGQTNKARELVALSIRTNRFEQLCATVKKQRPYLFDQTLLTQKPKQERVGIKDSKKNDLPLGTQNLPEIRDWRLETALSAIA